MCLAKSDAPIDKEGVVRSRMLGDLHAGRACELIRLALHEVRKGEAWIEARLFATAHRRRRLRNAGRRRERCRGFARVRDAECETQGTTNRDRRQFFNSTGKAVFHPLQHEAVRSDQSQTFSRDLQP